MSTPSTDVTVGHLLQVFKGLDPRTPVSLTTFAKFAVSDGDDGHSQVDHCRVVSIATDNHTRQSFVMLANASWTRAGDSERFTLEAPAAPRVTYMDFDSSNPLSQRAGWEQMNLELSDPIPDSDPLQ